ncbi:MAG: hypothetical protein KC550_06595 [Nanoarchaeota archaeon]|nr:hypothetical protein [Nanoarchaeota archaeon]
MKKNNFDLFCCPCCQSSLIRKELGVVSKVFYCCNKCSLEYVLKNEVLILLPKL